MLEIRPAGGVRARHGPGPRGDGGEALPNGGQPHGFRFRADHPRFLAMPPTLQCVDFNASANANAVRSSRTAWNHRQSNLSSARYHGRTSAPVRSPIAGNPFATSELSRVVIPSSTGRCHLLLINRRIDVVSY